MGYINEMYGERTPDFIRGFLAAIDTYAVHLDEKETKIAMKEAVIELGGDPEKYMITYY